MDESVKKGATTDPHLGRVWRAQRINRYMGGMVVSPWTVDELDEEWVNVFDAIFSAGERHKEQARINGIFEKWRKSVGYRDWMKPRH